jgi:SpoIID/LytB domain protein
MTRGLSVGRRFRAPVLIVGALFLCASTLGGCARLEVVREEPTAERRPPSEGPSAATVGVPFLRVGLAHNVHEAVVSCDDAFAVSLFSEEERRWESPEGGAWAFRASGGEGVEASGPGAASLAGEGTIRVTPMGGSLLALGDALYRGEIEVFTSAPGSLSVVNVVDVESYLRGVVPTEIGPRVDAEIEAVKAQVVAARTYAVASSGLRAGGDFDVFATVEDQAYGGAGVEDPVSDRAVAETGGIIAAYGGEPIRAYFHANCGGRTESRDAVWELPALRYLKPVWDTPGGSTRLGSAYCAAGANFIWTETWSGGEIEALVRELLPSTASTPVAGPINEVRGLAVTERTDSGRVRWLTVETDAGTYRVFGDRVRWLLRRPGTRKILRSAWFDLEVYSRGGRVTEVRADGRGYGHGVGMCQDGALEMAREGYTYEQILKHYYQGVGLERAYMALPESD